MAEITELTINKVDYDIGGGGSGLPSVTASDNGDVLTVVDGAWAKAASPVLVITEDMLIEPTADGLTTTEVGYEDADGYQQFLEPVYLYNGDFSALGDADNPKAIMAFLDGFWYYVSDYDTIETFAPYMQRWMITQLVVTSAGELPLIYWGICLAMEYPLSRRAFRSPKAKTICKTGGGTGTCRRCFRYSFFDIFEQNKEALRGKEKAATPLCVEENIKLMLIFYGYLEQNATIFSSNHAANLHRKLFLDVSPRRRNVGQIVLLILSTNG